MVKNKRRNTILIITFIVLLSLSIFSATQIGLLSAVDEGNVNVASGSFIGVPVYGTLSCEPSKEGNINIPSSGYEQFSTGRFFCQSQVNLVDGCNVEFKMPDSSVHSGKFDVVFRYVICNKDDTTCNLGPGSDTRIPLRTAYVASSSNSNRVLSFSLTNNQVIIAEYGEAGIIGSYDTSNKEVGYKYTLTPYQIYRYDSFSQNNLEPLQGSLDCAIDNNRAERNYLITGLYGDGKQSDELQISEYLNLNNLRQKGATVSYLTKIVAIVPQYQFFDDDSKYCADRKIYAVETVQTTGGTYRIADTFSNKVLQSVGIECCHDFEVPGFSCENFKLVPASEVTTCSFFKPCPYSAGLATADKKYITQYCEEGQCVTETINVACNFNSDCANGICDVDPNNPTNNKCTRIDPLEECGNGICQKELGETSISCPSDCGPGVEKDNTIWIIIAIVVGVLVLLGGIAYTNRGSGKGGPIKL